MPLFTKLCFISVASFLVFLLAAFGIGGVIINSHRLEHTSFHGNWPLNHKPGIVLLMACQIAFIIAAFPGIIGIAKGSMFILFLPAFIYLGVFSTMTILGAVSLKESSKDMSHEITEYLAKSNDLKWISRIQWENDCCGVKSYMDYQQLNLSQLEQFSVPQSCCLQVEKIAGPDCGNGVLAPSKNFTEIAQLIFTKGCNTYINKAQSELLVSLGTEMIVAGVVAGFLAAFLYWGIFSLGIQEANERNFTDPAVRENEAGAGDNTKVAQDSNAEPQSRRKNSKKRSRSTRTVGSNDSQNNNEFILHPQLEAYLSKIFPVVNPPKRLKTGPALKSTPGKSNKNYATLPKSFRKPIGKRYYNPNVEMIYKPKNSMFISNNTTPSTSKTPEDFLQDFRELQLGLGYFDFGNGKFLCSETPKAGENGFIYSSSLPSIRSVNCKRVEFLDPKIEALAMELSSKLLPASTSSQPPTEDQQILAEIASETEEVRLESIAEVPEIIENNPNNTTENEDSEFTDADPSTLIEPIILEQNAVAESGEMIPITPEQQAVAESGEMIVQEISTSEPRTDMDEGLVAIGGTGFMNETNENKVEIEIIEPVDLENEVYIQL